MKNQDNIIEQTFFVGLMHCTGCEQRIEQALKKIPGVVRVNASFKKGQVSVTYDQAKVSLSKINEIIDSLGYEIKGERKKKSFYSLPQFIILVIAVYLLFKNIGVLTFVPEIEPSMGYGLLFITGLLVSIHCIGMCGGINLSQAISKTPDGIKDDWFSKLGPSLLYNGGRVISYTLLGGLAGALGSVIGFTGAGKGIVAIISGVLMMLIGLNMLDFFKGLRKLIPSLPKGISAVIYKNKRIGPFLVGILNGFMPCGPLQAMQMYALGSGSFAVGAISMFMFSLGTLPLMFIFGVLGSLLSRNFSRRMLKGSAVFILVLGLIMLNRGMSLSGIGFLPELNQSSANTAQLENGIQVVTTRIGSGSYSPIVVYEGIPVRWIIEADEKNLNGCNNPIIIPEFDLEVTLVPGKNVIEFTPEKTGTIQYSCWMGMIRSTINVVEKK